MTDMTHTLIINDTHAVINKLVKEYQIPQKTAEGMVHIFQEVQVPADKDTATKEDVEELKKGIKEWERRVDDRFTSIHHEIKMLMWVVGINATATVTILILLASQAL